MTNDVFGIFEEFDKKDIYPTIFEKMFGRRNIASAFNNFYENNWLRQC